MYSRFSIRGTRTLWGTKGSPRGSPYHLYKIADFVYIAQPNLKKEVGDIFYFTCSMPAVGLCLRLMATFFLGL